jgi:hypothetical protein
MPKKSPPTKVLKLVTSKRGTKKDTKKPIAKVSTIFMELSGDIPGRYTFAVSHANYAGGKKPLITRNVRKYHYLDSDGFLILEVEDGETIVYPIDSLYDFRFKKNV